MNEDFVEIVGTKVHEMRGHNGAGVAMATRDAPTPRQKITESGGHRAWAEADGKFWGTPQSHKVLPSGVYRLNVYENLGPVFLKQKNDTDSLVALPDSESAKIVAEIQHFKGLRDKFTTHGFLYKRGILMWGPPGSGKTCTLQLLMQMLMQDYNSIAVLIDHPGMAGECLQALRRIEPDRQVIAILEDLDALCQRFGESEYLSLLDGESQVDNIVYVACVTPEHRLLTKDLRWVPAGDLRADQELWTLDERSGIAGAGGRTAARRFRPGRVVSTFPARKECVRVHLETGESFVCTVDHPWLAAHKSTGQFSWVLARDLCPSPRNNKNGGRYVQRAFHPWETDKSWEAGWVAGMLDGEGHIMRANGRAGHAVGAAQVVGPTLDQMVETIAKFIDIRVDLHEPSADRPHHQRQGRIRTNGGFEAVASFLGRTRPNRLIRKFDLTGGIVQGEKVRVVRVESVGEQWIQSIQTSTRTYFGEGFAMHNTTNYPERLDKRFVDRPSRFDTIRYIGMPTAAARQTYLKAKVPALDEQQLSDYVRMSDGYSIAHLRELIILTRCFEVSLTDAVARLNATRQRPPSSAKAPDAPAFGFTA